MNTILDQLEVNGVKYVRESAQKPIGPRAVLIIDRGWIFAGDVERKDGRIYLTRALHVKGWDQIGLDGMIASPKSPKVRLAKIPDLDFPADAELFAIPVDNSWGL